ncbi:hypothetical protein OBBRIDRAFT_837311 [Obba rivulosa]|uniref:Uncharacterized protein n=1 Tax=Obba rivulosa TaxID=1052685 RepID=A0A8E2DHW3_9APHY|nr:hypothetical protein OBBRIDRAFT_837311 [Obba rivulosa]
MSSQSQSLEIAPLQAPLAACTPNLMPFHIAYSGPAPISTYLRVRPAPALVYGKEDLYSSRFFANSSAPAAENLTASSSRSTLVATSSSVTLDVENEATENAQVTLVVKTASVTSGTEDVIMEETLVATSSAVTLATEDIPIPPSHSAPTNNSSAPESERWISSFRGRSIQGLTVPLPEGYIGIVLRTPLDGASAGAANEVRAREREREKAKAKAQKESRRGTRRSARVIELDLEDEDMDGAGHDTAIEGGAIGADLEEPVRTLTATSTFSQFVLWNPDFPVDEGKDEYLRSLSEWTKLATEIHRVDL